jgi:hypothetical protein
MTKVRRFGRFWYDFVVGDDWTIAVAVAIAVGATVWLSHIGEPDWFVLPIVVVGVLGSSIWQATRAARKASASAHGRRSR